MRLLISSIIVLASTVASAAPSQPTPMAGPFKNFADTCRAAKAARCTPAASTSDYTATMECDCRSVGSPSADTAIVTVDYRTEDRYANGGTLKQAFRDYLVAIHRADGWWVTGDSSRIDLGGASYGSSNCCTGHAAAPWFAAQVLATAPGFAGATIALQIGLPTWRTARPNWQPDPALAAERRVYGELLLCGPRGARGSEAACVRARMPTCLEPHRPKFAIAGDDLVTSCDGEASSVERAPLPR
jgi:hypothetical protein